MGWFGENAPWVFSGIGVAALSGLGWVARRLVLNRRSGNLRSNKTVKDVISAPVSVQIAPSAGGLTAAGITRSVRSAPLLQQPQIAAHYVGVAVAWETELVGAQKNPDGRVQLQLSHVSPDGTGGMFVYVYEADYPGLGLLRQGHAIRVSGKIAKANNSYIELEDTTIRFDPA